MGVSDALRRVVIAFGGPSSDSHMTHGGLAEVVIVSIVVVILLAGSVIGIRRRR